MSRFKVTFWTLVAAAMLLTSGAACSRREVTQDTTNSRLARAHQLIDENRPDEAIVILEPMAFSEDREQFEAEKIRAALASAYVRKAGVSAASFYGFARAWVSSSDDEEDSAGGFSFFGRREQSAHSERSGTGAESALKLFEEQGLEALALILRVKARFNALPSLDRSQDVEMANAVRVLDTIQEPSAGVALYRALIKTLRLKYVLVVRGLFSATVDSSVSGTSCDLGRDQYIGSLQLLVRDSGAIASDLVRAFPSSRTTFDDVVVHTRTADETLQRLRTTSSDSLEKYNVSEVVRFVRQQLGWNWSCRD